MPVMDMVQSGTFRQDLLYRINTVEINLPPLRERKEDISLLADHFMEIYSKKYKRKSSKWSTETLKKLQSYHWPGNIRELQHAIERAIILSESDTLQTGDFLFSPQGPVHEEEEFESYNLEHVESIIIKKTLKKYQGNISRAAKELGLSRAALYRRMERYNL